MRAARRRLADASARLAALGDVDAAAGSATREDRPYPAWIERGDRPSELELRPPFLNEGGHCFRKPVVITRVPPDDNGAPQRSRCQLLENGAPLGPAHAVHAEIVDAGRGRYSHWRQSLYFSTSDNSDPNGNGRSYRLVVRP